MLHPESRNLFLEALRPPPGYALDRAIGTTFTLDLQTLLTTPLAFTFFDWEDQDGGLAADPLALLEALRRHADRIHLFCEAGHIAIPPANQPLLAYLEGSVIEVKAPRRAGIFHPKVWLLRYISAGAPVVYRIICSTRNLTFARAWDTILVLDGELTNRRNAIAMNHPLGDFVRALPLMAVRPVSNDSREWIGGMEAEVRRVQFDAPAGFKLRGFWPLGIGGRRAWPFPKLGRPFLVLSPFVADGMLKRLSDGNRLKAVISRPESLDALATEVQALPERILVMSSDSELESRSGAEDELTANGDQPPTPQEAEELSGLHAKLFVMDDGWNARFWTGSANATDAAFSNNVEFLVELEGPKGKAGIDALLGDERSGLQTLLDDYEPRPVTEEDETNAELTRQLEELRDQLISAKLEAVVASVDGEAFCVSLVAAGELPDLPDDAVVTAWPVTVGPGAGQPLALDASEAKPGLAAFGPLSFNALTGFFVFQVEMVHEGDSEERTFVLNLPLLNQPADRRARILRSLLTDSEQLLRLLFLLLSREGLSTGDFASFLTSSADGRSPFGSFEEGTLLESMLKALHRDPQALRDAHRVIEDLRGTPEGRDLIPDGLEQIWDPIWAACPEVDHGT